MLNHNMLFAMPLTLLFSWLGLYLSTRHRRGMPAWWTGIAFVGMGCYSFLSATLLWTGTQAMRIFIARLITFPVVVSLVASYSLGVNLRHRDRPMPKLPLRVSALVGIVFSLLSAINPYLLRNIDAITGNITVHNNAGLLRPLWSTYVIGMIVLGLYHFGRTIVEQPAGTRRKLAKWRFVAALPIIAGGIGDNVLGYGAPSAITWLAGWAYLIGGVLMVCLISIEPAVLPRLRVLRRDMLHSAVSTGGVVLCTLGIIWVGGQIGGAEIHALIYLTIAYWTVTIVMLWHWWERALDILYYREVSTLRRQLQALLRQATVSPPLDERIAQLIAALARALGCDEVMLARTETDAVHHLAHYDAFKDVRSPSPLSEALSYHPDPATWREQAVMEKGLVVPVPGQDNLWVLAGEPAMEAEYERDDRELVEMVAAQVGKLLATASASDRALRAMKQVEEVGEKLHLALEKAISYRATRQALRYIYDPPSLGRTLLAAQCPGKTAWERGETLRELILRGIEAQRPLNGENGASRRRYQILVQRYCRGLPAQEVWEKLHISERQYYRDQQAGVQALAEWLRWQFLGRKRVDRQVSKRVE